MNSVKDRSKVHETTTPIPESEEVREHRERVATPAARTNVRWLRWLPLTIIVVGALAVGLVIAAMGSDDVVEWPDTPTSGPGSNSLAATFEVIDWPEPPAHGPGSQSLAATAEVVAWPDTPVEGPGSHSLGAPEVIAWPDVPIQGPASNSLGVPD